jgi:putative endonuclease
VTHPPRPQPRQPRQPRQPGQSHPPRPSNRRIVLGRAGEGRAAAWYAAEGYQVIERNWRSRLGEIDLICARGNLLVFCEVKTRRNDRLGSPVEAVTRPKQLRLRRLAAEYLFLHTCGGHDVRFDVAAIVGTSETGQARPTLTVIEAAF